MRATILRLKPAAGKFPPRHAPPVPHVHWAHRHLATFLGAGMWFFLFYRFKKDGPVLLGQKHPWDH